MKYLRSIYKCEQRHIEQRQQPPITLAMAEEDNGKWNRILHVDIDNIYKKLPPDINQRCSSV